MKRIYFFILIATILGLVIRPNNTIKAESDPQAAFLKRVAEYKINYPVTLTDEDAELIKDGCDVIKQKVIDARNRINETTTSRENIYGNIERRLAAIQNRFSLQRLDTSVIDLSLASYRIEVSNFKNSADKYTNILNDAISIDCKTEPSAFKSSIFAARDARQYPVNAMKRVGDVYNSTILNGFKLLENQLNEK